MPRRRYQEPESLAEIWGGLRADYNMAKSSRFRRTRSGTVSMGSGHDYHYRSEADYLKMMELARDMDRNDMIVGQTVDRAVANILQDGFQLDPQTGDEAIDKELKARWTDWADDADQCDSQGERTFWEIEEACLRSAVVDGDHFVLPIRDGTLQCNEGHRCRTATNTRKNVVHGVLLDSRRRRQEYWFTRDEISPMRTVTRVADIVSYPARDRDGHKQVWQIWANTLKRVSQTRGVTAFAPIVDVLNYCEDIQFARMVQAQLVACFAIFRERAPGSRLSTAGQVTGEQTTETLEDGTIRTIEGRVPGLEVIGAPGEKLNGFSPNVPNPEFFPHMRLLLTIIGINLGMPLVMVLLDASETNFSGFRGAVDQARLGFRRIQRRLRNRLHVPTYRWKVRQWGVDDPALLRANERSGVDIFAHRWGVPGWPYVQPRDDVMVDLAQGRNCVTSRRRIAARRGEDWDEVAQEIVDDNARLIRLAHEKAQQLNKELPGLNITWREVACPPTPDGVRLALTPSSSESEEAPKRAG